jgi:hypothetical protein
MSACFFAKIKFKSILACLYQLRYLVSTTWLLNVYIQISDSRYNPQCLKVFSKFFLMGFFHFLKKTKFGEYSKKVFTPKLNIIAKLLKKYTKSIQVFVIFFRQFLT